MKTKTSKHHCFPPFVVTASEMQKMDRQTIENFGLPGRVLMENAGRGATRFFLEKIFSRCPGTVAIAAGRGNNGGDGFVMARYLAQNKIPVTVYLLAESNRVKGDAAANLRLLNALNVPVIEMPEQEDITKYIGHMMHADYWIDAIFGTGLKSDVRGRFAKMIDFINSRQQAVFSVDIPSGINADNGQVCGIAIRAAATASFAFAKIGHLSAPGAEYCGDLRIIDIGIPDHIARGVNPAQYFIDRHVAAGNLSPRPMAVHKGSCGHVLVAAGAVGKTGAAAMTAEAALRAGAGLVTLASPGAVQPVLASRLTEVMTAPIGSHQSRFFGPDGADKILELCHGKSCLALGPGIGTGPETAAMVKQLVQNCPIPMVIDADGLNCLAKSGLPISASAPVIMTPHPGEMARLNGKRTNEIQADRIEAARRLATANQAVVVLKGARTIVAGADGRCGINLSGNPGMAAGGMGDVLTGLIAGFISQGLAPEAACQTAVWIHGAAADRLADKAGPWGYSATEVSRTVVQITAGLAARPASSTFQLQTLG